jgi:hypothetical protein
MSFAGRAADMIQRAGTLALFGGFVASGVGIFRQCSEFRVGQKQRELDYEKAAAAAASQQQEQNFSKEDQVIQKQ